MILLTENSKRAIKLTLIAVALAAALFLLPNGQEDPLAKEDAQAVTEASDDVSAIREGIISYCKQEKCTVAGEGEFSTHYLVADSPPWGDLTARRRPGGYVSVERFFAGQSAEAPQVSLVVFTYEGEGVPAELGAYMACGSRSFTLYLLPGSDRQDWRSKLVANGIEMTTTMTVEEGLKAFLPLLPLLRPDFNGDPREASPFIMDCLTVSP